MLTDNLIVVDVDCKAGKKGFQSLTELDLPLNTLTVRTPSGGLHLYFSGPNRANGVNRLGDGLDVRSYHGYVVAPGSSTAKGYYELVTDKPVLEAPAHLIARLDAPRERRETQTPLVEPDDPSAIQRAADFLKRNAAYAIEGSGGDNTTFKVAATIKDFGVSEATALELMLKHWNERCSPPWSPEELERKVANAYAYGCLPPGAAHPGPDFANVVVPPPEYKPEPARTSRFFRHGDEWQDATAWLYHDMLPASGTALLVGPSGVGKSFLAIDLAVSLATGREFFGVKPDERGGTFYVATEAGTTLMKRLEAAAPSSLPLPIYVRSAGALNSVKEQEALWADITAASTEMRERFGVPCRLIVFDTLSASGLLTDENDNAKAAAALAHLNKLSEASGALVMATHHPPKSGTGERGAGALRANVDAILTATLDDTTHARAVELTKSRDAEAPRALGSFKLNKVILSKDARGRDVTACTVEVGAPETMPKHKQRPAHCDAVLTAIDHGTCDDGETIQGRKFVDWGIARERFTELGPQDSSYASRCFKNGVRWASEFGAVEVLEHFGRKYLRITSAGFP